MSPTSKSTVSICDEFKSVMMSGDDSTAEGACLVVTSHLIHSNLLLRLTLDNQTRIDSIRAQLDLDLISAYSDDLQVLPGDAVVGGGDVDCCGLEGDDFGLATD